VAKTTSGLSLAGFDDIFNLGADGVQVTEIPLAELFPLEFHPFNVVNDDAMQNLAESIRQYGVREPGLARERADGGYELLAGNHRKMACEIVGLATLPVIVRTLNNDEAAIAVVDSNLLHREKLLYSEKAWAYRMKLEALDHSGVKGDMHSYKVLIAQTGDSKNQIYRLIRLTELVPALLDMVDGRKIAFNAAVELSFLTRSEQAAVVDCMTKYDCKPSLSQAVRLKKLMQDGTLTSEIIDSIFAETKDSPVAEPTMRLRYRKYFPPEYSPKQVVTVIIGLLKEWRQAQREVATV
jgi:ParB family chromosome partitioning protein